MGVDCNFYVLYGIDFNEEVIHEEWVENKDSKPLFFLSEKGAICYNYKRGQEYNLEIKRDPYSGDWQVIGISFLSGDLKELKSNLDKVESKWKEVWEEFLKVYTPEQKYEPSVIYDAYFD